MLVNFNPNLSYKTNYLSSQKQNPSFGSYRTATDFRNNLLVDLMGKRLSEADAIKKIDAAIEAEDKIGKKLLQFLKDDLLRKGNKN